LNRRSPTDADFQRDFNVTPPSVRNVIWWQDAVRGNGATLPYGLRLSPARAGDRHIGAGRPSVPGSRHWAHRFLHLRHRLPEATLHRDALGLLQTAALFVLLGIALNVSTILTVGFTPGKLVWPPAVPGFTWHWPGLSNARDWLPELLLGMLLTLAFLAVSALLRLRELGEPVPWAKGTKVFVYRVA
jgi:hypothetical protein